MKNLRKITAIVLLVAMTLTMAGCDFLDSLAAVHVSTTDHVQNLATAYTGGDIEAFKKGVEDDNKILYLLNAVGDTDSEGMKGVYQKVYELTSAAEITVVGVSENDGTVSDEYITIQIKTVDFTEALNSAMADAAAEGGEAFADMPGWMMEALNTGGVPVEKEFDVRIDSRGILAGETHNEEFWDVLTGGFYDYITYTMTTCTAEEGNSYLVASYDHVIYSLDEYYESLEGYELTDEEIAAYVAAFTAEYEGLDGLAAGGGVVDNSVRLYQFVSYETASSYTLQRLGIVSGGYADYISLSASVKGFEAEGVTCETTDFGSGVLDKEESAEAAE